MYKKVILVEGPDASGKTTFIKNYFSSFVYFHSSKPKENTVECIDKAYTDMMNQIECLDNKCIIIDRAVYSNLIYSIVFKDSQLASPKVVKRFLSMIDKVVICLPKSEEEYINNFKKVKLEREEKYKDEERMREVYREFKKLEKDVPYNYQHPNIEFINALKIDFK